MTTDYAEVMSGNRNETLIKILTVKRDQYQPEALEAAEQELEKRGLDLSQFTQPAASAYAVNELNGHTNTSMDSLYEEERRKQANKDMLYGALWCGGGLVATMADVGFIFWGAIVFGGIQFFKGLINSSTN